MIGPLVILFLSFSALLAFATMQGMGDVILIAGPGTLGSFILLVRAYFQNRRARKRTSANYIVIDGSNAMHWKDNTPQLATLRDIVHQLSELGFTVGVVFDANAGHILTGGYKHNAAMARLLGLPKDNVMVVPKGEPADPTILAAARYLDARILTNDRYRDWSDAHPELKEPGFLIRGGYRGGELWLDLDRAEA